MDQISPLESENQNPLRNHLFSAYLKFSLKNTGSYTKNIRSDSGVKTADTVQIAQTTNKL